MGVVLRAAALVDLEAILRIERSPGYDARVGRSSLAEHEAMLAGARHRYFVGEREGVEAFAILRDVEDRHGGVYLQRLAALPGRGAGGPFFGALLEWVFVQRGAHRVHLDSFDDNVAAHAFYAKFGFRREGLARQAYLAPDGRRRDLVLMALTAAEWR